MKNFSPTLPTAKSKKPTFLCSAAEYSSEVFAQMCVNMCPGCWVDIFKISQGAFIFAVRDNFDLEH